MSNRLDSGEMSSVVFSGYKMFAYDTSYCPVTTLAKRHVFTYKKSLSRVVVYTYLYLRLYSSQNVMTLRQTSQ